MVAVEQNNNAAATAVVVISTLITCGLMIPVWLFVGLIIIIVKIFSPEPKKPKPIYIPPSNDFASDWEYKILDWEANGSS